MVNAESEWDDPDSICYTRSEIQGSKLLNQSLLDSRMKYFGLRLRQIIRQMLQNVTKSITFGSTLQRCHFGYWHTVSQWILIPGLSLEQSSVSAVEQMKWLACIQGQCW